MAALLARALAWAAPRLAGLATGLGPYLAAILAIGGVLLAVRRGGRDSAVLDQQHRIIEAARARSDAQADLAGQDDREIDRWLRDPSRR